MFHLKTEQKICEIRGVRFGGQPGEYPTVIIPSIFQKGDRIFERVKRKKGFNEKRAEDLSKMTDKVSAENVVPCMTDIVPNTGARFKSMWESGWKDSLYMI